MLAGTRRSLLRYGENPHQRAAFYATGDEPMGLAAAAQLQGKELSFNNLNDTDAALALVAELRRAGGGDHQARQPLRRGRRRPAWLEAYRKALACDPLSAFGGIVACNRPLDGEAAARDRADLHRGRDRPGRRRGGARGIRGQAQPAPADPGRAARPGRAPATTSSGSPAASWPRTATPRGCCRPSSSVATRRAPDRRGAGRPACSPGQVVKHVKSNAIVLARDGATVGIGMGQTSRVDAVHLAARRAAEHAGSRPCVVASDAFFPFADGLLAAIEAGATAAIQPGGSVRDDEVIEAADDAGIAMVFTGIRHFRH